MNPVIETTTESGTKVIITPIEGVNLPTSLSELGNTIKQATMPSSGQMGQALEDVKEVLQEEASGLSDKGQRLAKDAEELIDSTTSLLGEKSKIEKLQRLISEGKDVVMQEASALKEEGKKALGEASKRVTGLSRVGGKAEETAENLYSYVRHLAFDFISSGEFRDLATDWVRLFQALGAEKLKQPAKKKRKITHSKKVGEEGEEEELPEKPASEQELMDRTVKDLTAMMDKISKSKEFQKAISNFYKLYDELKDKVLDAKGKLTDEAQTFKSVLSATSEVVAEFAGKEQLDQLMELLSDAWESVSGDKKLSGWFSDLRTFLTDFVENPESIADQKEEITKLLKKGRTILQQAKWRKVFNGIYDGLNQLLEKLKTDTVASNFAEKVKQFGKDLAFNDKGYPDLFVLEESVNQMKNLIIALFRKQLDNLPIKRIEAYGETYDVKLEDMTAVGSGFLPESLDIHMRNDSHVNFVDGNEDKMVHILEAEVHNIKPEFKNMKFHYKRKSFPTIEDFGMADLTFDGNGASIKVIWKIEALANSRPIATLEDVTCVIDNLSIRIIGAATKHEILDTLLAPFVAGMLKTKIANVIEEYLRGQLLSLNDQLNKFFESSPTQKLKEKASETMLDTFHKFQQTIQSK